MIEYLADIFYSSLDSALPMLRDAFGASALIITFLFPLFSFLFLFLHLLKKIKMMNPMINEKFMINL